MVKVKLFLRYVLAWFKKSYSKGVREIIIANALHANGYLRFDLWIPAKDIKGIEKEYGPIRLTLQSPRGYIGGAGFNAWELNHPIIMGTWSDGEKDCKYSSAAKIKELTGITLSNDGLVRHQDINLAINSENFGHAWDWLKEAERRLNDPLITDEEYHRIRDLTHPPRKSFA